MVKISKVKYSLQDIDYICPECHKAIIGKIDGKFFIPSSLEDWDKNYTNICPHCGTCFGNTTFIMFPHIKQFLPNVDPALEALIDRSFGVTINANDFFPACTWDIELEGCLLQFYFYLVYVEKLDPHNVLDALTEWKTGSLGWGNKLPSKELKKIRKLTGFKWWPIKDEEDE